MRNFSMLWCGLIGLPLGGLARADELVLPFTERLSFRPMNIVLGDNTLAELFPGAPAGFLIGRYDNAQGYTVAQKYPEGWSHPTLRLEPGTSFFAAVPQPPLFMFVDGTLVERASPTLYRGYNLISGASVPAAAGYPGDLLQTLASSGTIRINRFDPEEGGWSPPLAVESLDSCLFVASEGWPAHPAGSPPPGQAVYFNNWAPALGVNARFVDQFGRGVSGQAQLCLIESTGAKVPLGPPARLSTGDWAGYLDPTQDLVRYVPGSFQPIQLVVEASAGGAVITTAPITIIVGLGPLNYLPGLAGLVAPTVPATPQPEFLEQPADTTAALGTAAELRALFHYRGTEPSPEQSLHSVADCPPAGTECPIRYAWEKRTPQRTWVEIPNAATPILRFPSVTPEDYGWYRLSARWGEHVVYSAPAPLAMPFRLQASAYAGGSLEIQFSVSKEVFVGFDYSRDGRSWTSLAANPYSEGSHSIVLDFRPTPEMLLLRGRIDP